MLVPLIVGNLSMNIQNDYIIKNQTLVVLSKPVIRE